MKITCGSDNTKEFNSQLRLHLPEVMAFIRQMIDVGLMAGLRGTVLITDDDFKKPRDAKNGQDNC